MVIGRGRGGAGALLFSRVSIVGARPWRSGHLGEKYVGNNGHLVREIRYLPIGCWLLCKKIRLKEFICEGMLLR